MNSKGHNYIDLSTFTRTKSTQVAGAPYPEDEVFVVDVLKGEWKRYSVESAVSLLHCTMVLYLWAT